MFRYTTLVRRNFLRFGKRGDPGLPASLDNDNTDDMDRINQLEQQDQELVMKRDIKL